MNATHFVRPSAFFRGAVDKHRPTSPQRMQGNSHIPCLRRELVNGFQSAIRLVARPGYVGLALVLCFCAAAIAQQPSGNVQWKASPKALALEPRRDVPSGPVIRPTAFAPAPSNPVAAGSNSTNSPVSENLPADAARSTLSLEEAVRYALANNPQLASIRQQHGIAAAGIVIAKTYPYNPTVGSGVFAANGPTAAGITNRVVNQHKITIDVEVRGQRGYRQQAAFAALTRAEWEIASQEVTFAVNAIRMFDGLMYRQAKLALTEEFLKLNEKAAGQVKSLVNRGTLRPADLLLARAEVNDIRSQIGLHRTAIITARRDLARALGGIDLAASPNGTLNRPAPSSDNDALLDAALEHRPDLFARKMAVAEADSRLRLQIADRLGNLNIGPVYEYTESRVNYIGIQIGGPIPVFNRRQGEIKQREAERLQALLNQRQTETEIRQDVLAAIERVAEARSWAERYRKEILPDLRKSLDEINELFLQGQAGVDVLKVLDVRRKLLRAQDGYLDALLAYTQALAELALAGGDPALAMGLYQPADKAVEPKSP